MYAILIMYWTIADKIIVMVVQLLVNSLVGRILHLKVSPLLAPRFVRISP